jgi:Mor family transcriptional regulator
LKFGTHLQLVTSLFLSPHDILKKEIRKKIIEINEKRLRKKIALIMKKGDCSQPQLATLSWQP